MDKEIKKSGELGDDLLEQIAGGKGKTTYIIRIKAVKNKDGSFSCSACGKKLSGKPDQCSNCKQYFWYD